VSTGRKSTSREKPEIKPNRCCELRTGARGAHGKRPPLETALSSGTAWRGLARLGRARLSVRPSAPCVPPQHHDHDQDAHNARESPATHAAPASRNLRNEKVSLTTRLITKLLTNPLAQARSTADAEDQSRAPGPVHSTGRLSMAWKRSEDYLGPIWAQRRRLAITERLVGIAAAPTSTHWRRTDRSPPIWGSRAMCSCIPRCHRDDLAA
jgi:hypothetical protein